MSKQSIDAVVIGSNCCGSFPDDDFTVLFWGEHDRGFNLLDQNHIRQNQANYAGIRKTLREASDKKLTSKSYLFAVAYVFLARNCPMLTDYDWSDSEVFRYSLRQTSL